MHRVTHFELPADDPERIVAFYRSVFGWAAERYGEAEFWSVSTGDEPGGIDGAIRKRTAPYVGPTFSIEVPSIEQTTAHIVVNGGSEAVPRYASPGVGWVAYCTDPEGTLFALFEGDASAR